MINITKGKSTARGIGSGGAWGFQLLSSMVRESGEQKRCEIVDELVKWMSG